MGTKIEWTDDSWNPVTGCTKIAPGCTNCYAERLSGRFWGDRPFEKIELHPDRINRMLGFRRSRRIFVCSMGDLFHSDVPTAFIDKVFAAMLQRKQHTFQILTKRADSMLRYISNHYAFQDKPPEHIWLGVSAGVQKSLDRVIVPLMRCNAAVRFLSLEPLLESVSLRMNMKTSGYLGGRVSTVLNWVIVGGESGPGARECRVEWVRKVVQECQAEQIPVFVKQLGTYWANRYAPVKDTLAGALDPNGKGQRVSDWPDDLRIREMPNWSDGGS